MSIYNDAQQYRIALNREITNALYIVPWDTEFKTQLYKSICSIAHGLPFEVAAKIRDEAFQEVNKRLNPIR